MIKVATPGSEVDQQRWQIDMPLPRKKRIQDGSATKGQGFKIVQWQQEYGRAVCSIVLH